MNYTTLRASHSEAAFVIELDRKPRRNAISGQMMEEIIEAVASVAGESEVAGIVIHGGREIFSAGADLNEALALASVPESVTYFERWHRLCAALERSPKPVIAAIEGYCLTGGLELALACDIRIAGEGSSFGITSSRIGTVPGGGGAQRLARLIGSSRAMELLFSGEAITAGEAFRIGLINRIVPPGETLDHALSTVRLYAQRAPLSLAWNKRAVHRGAAIGLDAALEYETFLVSGIFSTADRSEGMAAFLEKRPANFKGR
jgi:enoyl-CoA hydratase/carnithine racemase